MTAESARRQLLERLGRHVPADALETAHLAATAALVDREPRCFERGTFSPGHITASAFVLDGAGRILLHHHRRLDRWLQLGGHAENETDPFVTALREAREESGLADLQPLHDGILDVDVHPIPAARGEPEHLHHDVRYLFRTSSPDALAHDEAESRALAFFSLEEARRLLDEASMDRVLVKIRAVLGS